MKILVVVLFATVGALAGRVWMLTKQRNYWKDSAMGNARGRIQMGKELREQEGQLNRNAAKAIARLNAENQDLRDELRRIKNLYRRALEQLDRRIMAEKIARGCREFAPKGASGAGEA